MPNAGRGPGFSYKTEPGRVVTKKLRVNDFQGSRTLQADIERFLSNPHCAGSELERLSLRILENRVVLEAELGGSKHDGIALGFESSAQGAHRAELAVLANCSAAN